MKGRTTRVLAILVIMMIAFALMPAQTVWAEDHLCPECGKPGFLRWVDSEEHAYFCETSGCPYEERGVIFDEEEHTNDGNCYCSTCNTYIHHVTYFRDGIHKAASCLTEGFDIDGGCYQCERCNNYYRIVYRDEPSEPIVGTVTPALGHKGGTATCTAKAVCEVCGQEYGEPLGHSWGAWTVTKEATTTEEGIETRVCSNDSSHIETRKIAKKEETKKEEPKKEAAKAETVSKTTDTQPQTGDENQTVWVIMMMLSAAILIVLAIRKRRVFD